MIPRDEVEIYREVPFERLVYPSREEIRDGSLGGCYRDTVPMDLGDWASAAWTHEEETKLIPRIASQADTAGRFDLLAHEAEGDFDDGGEVAGGVDLGVASAVPCLNAARCPTRVSCCGHPVGAVRPPWSTYPLVKFRADEARARLVFEAAEAAGWRLELERDEGLLEIWADRITAIQALAAEMLARRASFEALPIPPASVPDEDEEGWDW